VPHGCSRCAGPTASKLALTMWFQAAWLMATHKNGFSARQMREQLDLGSYKSALLCAKLRRAMLAPERNPLTGRSRRDQRFLPDQGRPAGWWAGT
jgi:hypothetical protein